MRLVAAVSISDEGADHPRVQVGDRPGDGGNLGIDEIGGRQGAARRDHRNAFGDVAVADLAPSWENGKIQEHYVFANGTSFVAQLGLMDPSKMAKAE